MSVAGFTQPYKEVFISRPSFPMFRGMSVFTLSGGKVGPSCLKRSTVFDRGSRMDHCSTLAKRNIDLEREAFRGQLEPRTERASDVL